MEPSGPVGLGAALKAALIRKKLSPEAPAITPEPELADKTVISDKASGGG